MRISDWSSDVCSSDLPAFPVWSIRPNWREGVLERLEWLTDVLSSTIGVEQRRALRVSPRRYIEITVNPTGNERSFLDLVLHKMGSDKWLFPLWWDQRSEEHTSELQSLMRISYAVFCLKKKKQQYSHINLIKSINHNNIDSRYI